MIRKIGLKDLPQDIYITFGKPIYNNEGTLVNIEESRELLLELAEDFKNKCRDVAKISKNIGIPRTLIPKLLGFKRKIRLEYLLKINQYLIENGVRKYTMEYLQNHVYAISSLHGEKLKPFVKINGRIERKLPFNFNTSEGIKCLTFPLSDGYINQFDDNYIRVGYTNSDLLLHKDLLKNIKATFGQVYYSQRKIYAAYETYFTGSLGKIYTKCLGFRVGNKVKNNISLPGCLIQLQDPKLIGSLLSQFIDDEGYFGNGTIDICIAVDTKLPKSNKFNREEYAPNILKDLKKLLTKLRVISHFRMPHPYLDRTQNKIKWTYHLQINGFGNIFKLYPYLILIKNNKKEKIQNYLSVMQKIYMELHMIYVNKAFQVSDLVNLLKISRQSTENYIRTFQRAKLIKLTKKGKYISDNGLINYKQAKYQCVINSISKIPPLY